MALSPAACRRFGEVGCADEVSRAVGLDIPTTVDCMGSDVADEPHPLLQASLLLQLVRT